VRSPGQSTLFDRTEKPSSVAIRWSVSVAGVRHPPTATLPLAVAQARAAVLAGYRAVIVGSDGCAADVRHDDGFLVIPFGSATWPSLVRRLLDEHG
jgi:hypothetical protein